MNSVLKDFPWKDFVVSHFFRNYVRFLSFSLYKDSLGGIEEKLGYELATVLNSTFFHLKVEVWRCNLL